MRLFWLSIIFICLATGVKAAPGWTVTVTLSAFPPEIIPVGYGLEGAAYDSPELNIWMSSGPPIDKDWPTDSPKLEILVVSHDLPVNVKVTSITVSATMIKEFLLTDTITKTFEVNYNENAYVPATIVPAFNSSFSSDHYNSLAK